MAKLTSFLADFEQWGLMDEVSDAVTFYGFPLTDGADPDCAIMKIEKVGAITTRKWSNGSKAQNIAWSTRAAVTYKYL